jgi:hypothetical protein
MVLLQNSKVSSTFFFGYNDYFTLLVPVPVTSVDPKIMASIPVAMYGTGKYRYRTYLYNGA